MTRPARMVESNGFPSFASNLALTSAAITYARRRHRGQRRASDGAPFILHPLEVAALLSSYGAGDAVVAAGVLHDVVEDTGTPAELIRRRFGPEVADLVGNVTEDPAVEPERARKAALRDQVRAAGGDAAVIFAADKVAKVRELRTRLAAADHPDDSVLAEADRKLDHYSASLDMLEAVIPAHPLVRQLRFELEALCKLPPAAERARRRPDREPRQMLACGGRGVGLTRAPEPPSTAPPPRRRPDRPQPEPLRR